LIGVGAGVGGTLLFVERGPQGAEGKSGPRGAPGPPGPAVDVAAETQDLEARISDLEFQIGSGLGGDLETRVSDLESQMSNLEFTIDDLCFELDLIC